MYTFKTFIFLTMLCVVKSETEYDAMCKDDFRDMNNKKIDVLTYCSDKLCVVKCCSADKLLYIHGLKCVKPKKPNVIKLHRAAKESINFFSSSNEHKAPKNFEFIQNFRNVSYCTSLRLDIHKYDISEDGSLLGEVENEDEKLDYLTYCIDYKQEVIDNKPAIKIAILQINQDTNNLKQIEKFENVGVLISSFFLLLVLVVYCLLPDLRNLTGLVLMAYTLTLLVAFIIKSIVAFTLLQDGNHAEFCKTLSPVEYFAFVSSIFWLSVYAFDVWWGLRSFRIKRNSKQGDLVKFMYYGLYAWGTPLLLTALIVTLDNYTELVSPKSLFRDCLREGKKIDYYYKIPIGILIFVNIVMFCMTVYNIWMVKRAVSKCHDSRSSKQQSSKFATYAKLCLMMGVTWCLELLPNFKNNFWMYMLNLGNLFTGLTIFYLFVCKKLILLQLCKKFNIRNNYINNLELEFARKRTTSGITRSTALSSTVRSTFKGKPLEKDLLQNCPKEENIS